MAQGDVEIQHHGADVMWADVNTKPLQGQMFCEFRLHLMGTSVEYDDDVERCNTHPKLLPKVEVEGVISKPDLEVRVTATGLNKNGNKNGALRSNQFCSNPRWLRNKGVC